MSIALWSTALLVARTRPLRVVVALFAATLLVVQALVFRYYHAPLDVQVLASAVHFSSDVKPVMTRAAPGLVLTVIAVASLELVAITWARRGWRGPPSWKLALGTAGLAGLGLTVLGGAVREATPDLRAIHALTALGPRREPARAGAIVLPPLYASPADHASLPNLLFVLTESVRATDYVAAGEGATAPETAALTRGRVDFRQMRAVASYTSLSLSALLTGRAQAGAREPILRAPSLFDFAHAARDDHGDRPTVAYFSSQSATVFETEGVHASVDRFVTVETLRGRDVEDDADYVDLPLDRDIVDHFVATLPGLSAPLVAVLHLVGTHAPYFVDASRAPFAPYDHVVTWSGMPKLLAAYRDAIYEQDRTVARAVSAFVAHVGRRPWLVVFTSDHGEAFGEHDAIHHGQNLMDEQVHVPGWIAASDGALSPAQAGSLRDHADRFVTHLDVLPTLLDAMGLWDNFAVSGARAAMEGRSLLRPYEARAPIPVTNCTGMFQCPVNAWGLYGEERKLVARAWDPGWWCFKPEGARESVAPPDDPACARLRRVSRDTFPLLPNGAPNR